MDISKKWPQNRNALNDDGADDLGGVPDVRVCVAPEVPFVLGVATVFPASADGSNDGDDHSETHGQTKTNFLVFTHVEFPCDEPGEGSHHEVHDDVVNLW